MTVRRQKKNKKMQMPKAIEGLKEYLIKKVGIIIVSVVSVALVWALTTAFFEKSDYFRLRAVETKGAQDASLAGIRNDILKQYKDRNLFRIDIKAIAKSIEPKYPDAKEIAVKRVLPDKLLLDLKFRRPVALLGNGQVYPIDREGVILVNINSMKLKDFPIIRGIDPRLAGKSYKKNESKNLVVALNLLDEIRRTRFLEKYNVRLVDAGDVKSLSFYLGDGGPAVIIGHEDFRERLAVLKDTLRDPRLVLEKINYIDVRFNNVAISPK
ncbi:MAG: FtsQ-type POTRA domain-containing protein [Candidatus Omnitrophota bacterium]|nr:FtsQ-type POTRA domain-containing protein [Candidatus Omnitrophota bacterium]